MGRGKGCCAIGLVISAIAGAAEPLPRPTGIDPALPLGAPRNTAEVHATTGMTLRAPWAVDWGFEGAWAPARGLALEVEVGIRDLDPRLVRLGIQGTFHAREDGSLAHGILFQTDVDPTARRLSNSWLYLFGARMAPRWSVFVMAGPRVRAPWEAWAGVQVGAEAHASFFWDVHPRVILGSEQDVLWFPPNDLVVQWLPQVQARLHERVQLHAGVGMVVRPWRWAEEGAAAVWTTRIVVGI